MEFLHILVQDDDRFLSSSMLQIMTDCLSVLQGSITVFFFFFLPIKVSHINSFCGISCAYFCGTKLFVGIIHKFVLSECLY